MISSAQKRSYEVGSNGVKCDSTSLELTPVRGVTIPTSAASNLRHSVLEAHSDQKNANSSDKLDPGVTLIFSMLSFRETRLPVEKFHPPRKIQSIENEWIV